MDKDKEKNLAAYKAQKPLTVKQALKLHAGDVVEIKFENAPNVKAILTERMLRDPSVRKNPQLLANPPLKARWDQVVAAYHNVFDRIHDFPTPTVVYEPTHDVDGNVADHLEDSVPYGHA